MVEVQPTPEPTPALPTSEAAPNPALQAAAQKEACGIVGFTILEKLVPVSVASKMSEKQLNAMLYDPELGTVWLQTDLDTINDSTALMIYANGFADQEKISINYALGELGDAFGKIGSTQGAICKKIADKH